MNIMLVLVERTLRNMRVFFALLLVFCSRQTGVDSERFLEPPRLIDARPLSYSSIYLAWKGPIHHPGGLMYRIYLKKESKTFEVHRDIPGSSSSAILNGLDANVRYTVCVRVVDKHYKAAGRTCDSVAVITTPAQLGHVSKTDRKYLTKGGFVRGARHYWPFDYDTQLRDVKYSRDGKQRGNGVKITGRARGYLSIDGDSWVRLGRFLNECVCDVRHCVKNGVSVGLWIKLSGFDNETKIILGSDKSALSNSTGLVIFQSTLESNGTKTISRHVSTLVFITNRKWMCSFPVEPENWFYLTVTWSKHFGLRMFKNGELMSEQKWAKVNLRVSRHSDKKCAVILSPPSARGTLRAYYDNLIIWQYELNRTLMYQVYKNAIEPPGILDCKTSDGISADVYIDDKDHIYNVKGDYKISWKRKGSYQQLIGSNFTTDHSFTIKGLAISSEYVIEVQRRVFVAKFPDKPAEAVLSKASKATCKTHLDIPGRPKLFTVREKAPTYLSLQWQPPDEIHGSVLGYRILYRVDDFCDRVWEQEYRSNVHRTFLGTDLKPLKPFTDYIIKLSCQNEHGTGKATTLRVTTGEGKPSPPRSLFVRRKRELLVIKWQEPAKMKGLVDYRLFAVVNGGSVRTICNACGESYRMGDVDQHTTYTFWIIAYNKKYEGNDKYESKPSRNVTITTPSFTPSPPINLATNFTRNGIRVTWEKSNELNGKIAYKLFGFVNDSKRVFCDKCGLHYVIQDVPQYTVYTFWALAYNVRKINYESQPSLKVTIDTGSYVPTIPRSLTVNLMMDRILVTWNESHVRHGSVQYQLMGRENSDPKKIFCEDCGLKYLINRTEPNMNYSFWVVAHNSQNGYESLPSSVVNFHTAGDRLLPPEHILASEVKYSSAKITWNRPEANNKNEIIGYKVTVYDAFSILDIQTTESLQLEIHNLTQFSKYYVTVQVLSGAGYGPPSQQLTIQTKDKDECATNDVPCAEHAKCFNSVGSYFCSCLNGYVGDGKICKALPPRVTKEHFCPEEQARNVTWKKTYHGQTDKNLCPDGTIGISTRKCLKRNDSRSYWSDPNMSNCVSAWISEVDDKLADRRLNSTAVGDFFLNLLDKNSERGLYGGDVIKSVNVIDLLYNKSKHNELDEQKSNPKVAETLVKNLINITEKIVSPETIKVWNDIPKGRRTEECVKVMDGLENAVLKSARIVNFSFIQSEYIDVRCGRVASFARNGSGLNEMNSINLPQQEKENHVTVDQTVAVIKYNTIGKVLSSEDHELTNKDILNSAVLSILMNPPLSTPFEKPLEFKLNYQKDGKFDNHKCAFFNTSRYPGFWSTNGCEVFNVSDTFTVCHCYHMTSFSVLMQVQPAELLHSDELILGWLTRVGLCISLVCLGLAFITFVFLPRPCGYRSDSRCFRLCEQGYRPTYLKKVRTSIHANLILSLALGEALFLWGIDKRENQTTCYTVAVALHYSFLVAFHWMAAEGVILYLCLVKVFQRKSANKDKRMFMIICWGTPAAIVCTALVVGHEYYLHEQCCWLSVTNGMIWAFVGPALLIILVNFFFLCCTFRVMGRRPRCDKSEKNTVDKIRYWAKGAAIVTCLLGVTWVFGVFFVNSDSVVVAYIFNICNVFQGLFIFIFHCLLDEKIRQKYYQVLCAVANVESRSPTHSTGTGKKDPEEVHRSTFNSWLWSVAPIKFQESSKSESCPTVAENTPKRLNSSTHSLSPHVDRRLIEIKRDGDTRPRGMSSIYHDSDENMDNIPDNILTVKHGSKNNSGRLDENSTEGVVEEYRMATLSRENSREFFEIPQATCEDCSYEIKEWEEQQEILRRTNSLHEQVLKKLEEPCSSLDSEHHLLDEDLNQETNIDEDELCHEIDQRDESLPNEEQSKQCSSFTSTVPHIVLSDFSKPKNTTSPKCYQMVKVTDSSGAEISSVSGKKLSNPIVSV